MVSGGMGERKGLLGEDLLAERPLLGRGQREEGHEPVEHALEELRDPGEHAQLALQPYDRLLAHHSVPSARVQRMREHDEDGTLTTQMSDAM